MRKSKEFSRRESLTLLGAGALAGGAAAMFPSSQASAQGSVGRVTISMGTTPQFSSVVVAQEGGHFKNQGLDTEITIFASGSVATEAFMTGQGNVVIAGDMPSVRLWSKGFVGVSPQASYSDLSIIVSKKELNKAEDFRGKKLGVLLGSTSEYFAGLFLASGGLNFDDVETINLQPAEMVTGLAGGDIDGFVIWQPFGWRAVEAIENSHVLTTAAPFFSEYQAVTTTKEYAGANEAELVAFLKGLRAAGEWTKQNPAEAASMVDSYLRMGNPDLARRMIDAIDFSLTYSPSFRDDISSLAKFAKIDLDWNTMFDSSFLQKVDPALVEI